MPKVTTAPATAITVMCEAATTSVATIHSSTPPVTTEFSDTVFRRRGIHSAPATAPAPKLADSRPKPPAPSAS